MESSYNSILPITNYSSTYALRAAPANSGLPLQVQTLITKVHTLALIHSQPASKKAVLITNPTFAIYALRQYTYEDIKQTTRPEFVKPSQWQQHTGYCRMVRAHKQIPNPKQVGHGDMHSQRLTHGKNSLDLWKGRFWGDLCNSVGPLQTQRDWEGAEYCELWQEDESVARKAADTMDVLGREAISVA